MTNRAVSVIMDGAGNRCFTCSQKIEGSCLVFENKSEGDVYFCGICVYANNHLGRPSSNLQKMWKEQQEKAEERKRIQAVKDAKLKFFEQFCCKKMGKLQYILNKTRFDTYTLDKNGRFRFITSNHYCENPYTCEITYKKLKHKKLDYKYCPYCRKEFIRVTKKNK